MNSDECRRHDDGVAVADSCDCAIVTGNDCACACSIGGKLAACAAELSCVLRDMNSSVLSSFFQRSPYRPIQPIIVHNLLNVVFEKIVSIFT